nr:sulfoquinovosyl transferase sqd2 [Quercus suber]
MSVIHTAQLHRQVAPPRAEFPAELVGKKVLLATESLGPVNGVSRTTQSLVDYLRANGVHVATCAPFYKGQPINLVDSKPERQPIVNPEWVRSIEAKSAALGSRAIGGAWTWHFDREEAGKQDAQPLLPSQARQKNLPVIRRSKSEDARKKFEAARMARENPEFRLQGYPLPYNPDLTVAYPFRLGVVYDKTFGAPDVIYLASPASVGFQFLIQLRQMNNPIPTLLNFQTDLSAYASILFPAPIDRYGVFLLQIVQGFLFQAPSVRTIFYPSAYVRKYMVDAGAPEEKMYQLGRGVDTQLFNPKHRDDAYRREIAPDGEIIFACICRIAPEKGFEFLAQAAQKLKDSGLRYKLLIVGGNKNPAVEDEVHRYFQGLEDRVIFTGMLRGTALARAYAAADVFLHCSITETFGLVVLESMASGVPVIARDEGGPSETVKHGVSGYLVAPHDLDTFVAHARTLALDTPLRHAMIQAARAQALDTTWDKINNQVAVQLAATLRAHPPKSPAQKRAEGVYGSWSNLLGVYFAVAIVWVFWFIAVVPMLLCGFVHGLFK